MIVEWFLSIAGGVADWALGFLGSDPAPEWMTTVGTFMSGQLASFAGLGAWIPWDFAILVWGSILTIWVAILLVKFVRWVIGLIPTMGGS